MEEESGFVFYEGAPIVWHTTWECIDDIDLVGQTIRVVYRNSRLFVWWYPEIKEAVKDLNEFLKNHQITDTTFEETNDLKDTLDQWIKNIEEQKENNNE